MRSSTHRAICQPLSQAFIDKHKDGVGPYMAAGLPAFLQGHAAVFIYAAGLTQGRRAPIRSRSRQRWKRSASSMRHTARSNIPPTNHNGFKDEGIVLVEASKQQANGGYPQAKL